MKLALAGDTMLGRGVAKKLSASPPESLFALETCNAGSVHVLALQSYLHDGAAIGIHGATPCSQ